MNTNTLIIGASAAGLSCAAHLKRRNVPFEIIEKQGHVGHAWRNHYHRLHLHTNRSSSHLPFLKFPADTPKYPSRQAVVDYLDNYCVKMGINPRFHTEASHIYRSGECWITETQSGTISSENLIICTGSNNLPKKVDKPGLATFSGRVLHSSEYSNGKEFKGQKVLVVGFGNSACEIAICLHEHGAYPSMSVRGPINVIPRDILGIPVLKLGILMSHLPPSFADKINKPLMDILVGDINKYGLKKLPYGPMEQIARDHSIPLLDIGTMSLIKQGLIKVFGDILEINGDQIRFENTTEHFDALVMATGYSNGLDRFISLDERRIGDLKLKISKRELFGHDSLYFCGYYVAPTGMLREINRESRAIADAITNS